MPLNQQATLNTSKPSLFTLDNWELMENQLEITETSKIYASSMMLTMRQNTQLEIMWNKNHIKI